MSAPRSSSYRPGFTLLEVVAALALLGGLLMAASVGRSRMSEQDRLSRDRLLAVELLGAWADLNWSQREEWASGVDVPLPPLVPVEAGKQVRERASRWRIEVVPGPPLRPRVEGVKSLRLVVTTDRTSAEPLATRAKSASDDAPLAVLDVLVADREASR